MDLKQSAPEVTETVLRLPPDFPDIPDDVVSRFSSMGTYQKDVDRWWTASQNVLNDFANAMQDVTQVGGVLQVNGADASMYIRNSRGLGAWNDPQTAFYVNDQGYLSLKNKLTWNPVTNTLTIEGTIIAVAGEIGGFLIGPDYIRDTNNSMGLASTVTGADDVRFWAGDTFANRAAAPFRVMESGAVVATNATISGSITATSGTIGGFAISATTISASNVIINSAGEIALGTGNDILIASAANATYRLWIGNATAGTASFSVTKAGLMTAVDGSFTTGTGGNYVSITSAGLRVGQNTATGVIYINNNAGFPYINVRYNGNVYGSWSVASTFSQIGLSDSGGSSLSMDPRNGYSALILNAGTPLLGILGPSSSLVFIDGGLFSLVGSTYVGNGSGITNLVASNLSTGTVPTARLGSGSATSSTYLRGDSTWATVGGGGDLLAANNLSDLASIPTARTNLGLVASATTDTTNASNISSGTLSNSRLPSAISVTSLATANFQASVGTAVDVISVNFRVFNGGTQNARIDYTTGFYYVQGNAVVGARGTRGAAGLTEVVALLDAWQAWS